MPRRDVYHWLLAASAVCATVGVILGALLPADVRTHTYQLARAAGDTLYAAAGAAFGR